MQRVVDDFHRLFYGEEIKSPILNSVTWFGIKLIKNPLDLMVYQEIMYTCRPDIIIETGTLNGGSALFFAHMAELMGLFGVITIDINAQPGARNVNYNNKIKHFTGSSTSPSILEEVKDHICGAKGRLRREPSVMVVLDSDHSKKHVLRELDAYSEFVTAGQYLIVEDSNIGGHPVLSRWGAGPYEAIHEWLPNHPDFVIDKYCERFLFTTNPDGFLRRTA
jgi:cephalosporin hydroxylase